ncbi:hypothetical protein FRC06_007389 [Ceratobasidium sp. 370]|nr:hypothetical protein FRC06_007389 [Ceratobasidium sp. 370]
MEHLHVPLLKEPYWASNHKEWIKQVVRYVFRQEIMLDYGEFMEWLQEMAAVMADGSPKVDVLEDEEAINEEDEDQIDEDQIGMASVFKPTRVGNSTMVDTEEDKEVEGEGQDIDKLPESPESQLTCQVNAPWLAGSEAGSCLPHQHPRTQTEHLNGAHGK